MAKRNVHKKVYRKAWSVILIVLLVCTHPTICVHAEENISLYATAAVLMDAASGRVLYGKEADKPLAMASTTKIMTCITILENGNPEDELSVSAYAASMPKVKLYIKKGETYRVKDLLFSLMLESHNDAAVALAEYIGSRYLPEEIRQKKVSEYSAQESKDAVSAFAALMNQKAHELGCENTYFITPNGLDATETITLGNGETIVREHCTTATELARIMAYCINESPQKNQFLEITRTASHSFTANGRNFSCNNHNAFLNMMEGALSGKTGFTSKAGYCYVGALTSQGRTFVVALLACGWPNHKTYKWSDTRELMEYGKENFFFREFLAEETALDSNSLHPIPVLDGQTKILGTTAYTGLTVEGREKSKKSESGLLMKPEEKIQVECQVEKSLQAPVMRGTQVGTVYYAVDGKIYLTEPIVTTDSVLPIDFRWCVLEVWKRFVQEM